MCRVRYQELIAHGAVATPEGARELRSAIQALLAVLEAGPAQIQAATLDLLAMRGCTADIAGRDLVAVGRAFADLVDGRIAWTAGDAPTVPLPTVTERWLHS